MNLLVIDSEATGAQRNHANPFDPRNKVTHFGALRPGWGYRNFKVEYDDSPYGEALAEFQSLVDQSDTLVLFNAKYDLHWMRRYGINFTGKRLFDCQTAFFDVTYQQHRMPSLNEALEHYGLPVKLDAVKTDYWDNGLDTDQVPEPLLLRYLEHDVKSTFHLYQKLTEEIATQSPQFRRRLNIRMFDLEVLEDMEWNGIKYNKQLSIQMGDDIEKQLAVIDATLRNYSILYPFNFGSGYHVSAFLFGGILVEDYLETYEFVYKGGRRKDKTRKAKRDVRIPQIIKPAPRTGLAKDGFFKTDDSTLRQLAFRANRMQREVIRLILERRKLAKKQGTYCYGLPKLIDEMGWVDDVLHGTLNQSVAQTGRLSSSHPNQQNMDKSMKMCMETRYVG